MRAHLLETATSLFARDDRRVRTPQRNPIIARNQSALAPHESLHDRSLFTTSSFRASARLEHHQTRNAAEKGDPGAGLMPSGMMPAQALWKWIWWLIVAKPPLVST